MAEAKLFNLEQRRAERAAAAKAAAEKQAAETSLVSPLPVGENHLLDNAAFEKADTLEKNKRAFDAMNSILESILTSATLEMHHWYESAPNPNRIYDMIDSMLAALQSPEFVSKNIDALRKMRLQVTAAMAACEAEAQHTEEVQETESTKKPGLISSLKALLSTPEEPVKSIVPRISYPQHCLNIRIALFELGDALDARFEARRATS